MMFGSLLNLVPGPTLLAPDEPAEASRLIPSTLSLLSPPLLLPLLLESSLSALALSAFSASLPEDAKSRVSDKIYY
jgi:hypothetical protein